MYHTCLKAERDIFKPKPNYTFHLFIISNNSLIIGEYLALVANRGEQNPNLIFLYILKKLFCVYAVSLMLRIIFVKLSLLFYLVANATLSILIPEVILRYLGISCCRNIHGLGLRCVVVSFLFFLGVGDCIGFFFHITKNK